MSSTTEFLPIFLVIAGFFLLFLGYLFKQQLDNYLKNGILTMGKIVELKKERTTLSQSLSGLQVYPIVEFTTDEGKTLQVPARYPTKNLGKYKIGQSVRVFYNHHNPYDLVVDYEFGILNWHFLLIVIGISCIVLGFGNLIPDAKRMLPLFWGS